MGIESDQLVYDYLSRVGDLAQRQQLSSGARMRLVATLRGEIDRQRGTDGSDSPAVVRRILGRLGAPDELVAAAAESGDGGVTPPPPRAARSTDGKKADAGAGAVPRARRTLRKDASRKGASPEAEAAGSRADAAAEAAGSRADAAGPGGEPVPGWPSASAPHMAGLDQQPSGGEPEWWRIEPGPFGEGGRGATDPGTAVPGFVGGPESPELFGPQGAPGPGTPVPGFVGGLESPELFGLPGRPKPPGPRAPAEEAEDEDEGEGEPDEEQEAAEEPGTRPRWRPRLRRRRRSAEGSGSTGRVRLSNPVLLLAAALLVAGAVLGSLLALAGGWLLAYSSRRFSRAEAKWVAMGLPGVVVGGAFVWLWGRMEGRWGSPLAADAMGDAMTDVLPVVVRVAAVASALYLVWRARRLSG
ncbi:MULTISPECIES: hypothetical protein [unclassified Streptomyces]|uniref:hypothetical protein n=1 Tax=unclassified Streptomyces TaxID=2593676 RepID=UPI00093D812A|nr:hypothetical protein [Streptomyces sp. CB02058]OKI97466.1 hypothetical protein AMK10_01100 [Streptomyces sp. CB02058]